MRRDSSPQSEPDMPESTAIEPVRIVPAGFRSADVERFGPEPPKRSGRSPFARDRARVLHSAGLRRLAAKTQVLAAGESDFPRTRLTHTLEVAQIAREMGGLFGTDPDLTDLAGLAHDLGHPPFGHNGEAALDQVTADIGGFEGNAQTFRMLTRIEVKVVSGGRSFGLNLTRAALDATIKYPWPRPGRADDPNVAGRIKFGCYSDDADVFDWVRSAAPERQVCFEAQVMDWSDDVAYCVHDVEDGIHAGHIDVRVLDSGAERDEIARLAHEWYASWAERGELAAALERIADSAAWPVGFDGGPADLAGLKHFTSTITGRFVAGAISSTRARYGPDPLRRFGADLVVARPVRCEVAALKALADLFVFQRAEAERAYRRQRDVLGDLVSGLLAAGGRDLDPLHRPVFAAARTDAQRLRAVVDQVASLTDHSVLDWHRRVCG